MALTITRRNLGQLSPSAAVTEDLFTCPVSSDAVVSTLVVCNYHTGVSIISVRNVLADAVTSNKELIFNNITLQPNETITATLGICLSAGDKIQVISNTGNVSFNLYGQLNTTS